MNYTFGFSNNGSPVTKITQTFQLQTAGLEWITGVFIDNKNNASGFLLTNTQTGQAIFCPANSQADIALIGVPGADNVTFIGETTGGVDVPCMFKNIEGTIGVYSTIAPGSTIGAVTVQGQVTALPYSAVGADAATLSITAGGTSQSLFGASAVRKRLLVANPASPAGQAIGANPPESLFIRFGVAASGAGVGGNIEIVPGGYFDTGAGGCDQRAINIVAATTGHVFAATQIS